MPINHGIPGAAFDGRYEDRLSRILAWVGANGGDSILDVGCGDGFMLGLIRRIGVGRDYYGVEIDPEAVIQGRKCGFDIREQSVEEPLPFSDGQMDVVIAGEILEHVVDPDLLLGEIRRVVAPTGYVILTTPNLLAWYNRILILAGVTPMFVEHSFRASYGPMYSFRRQINPVVGHVRVFNLTPLRAVVEQNRFKVTVVAGAARIPVRWLWWFDKCIARFRPSLAGQLMLVLKPA